MGANWDDGVSVGRNADEAFTNLTEDAAWEHGHGGYSGTMAEKDSFILAGTLPARVTFQDLLAAMFRTREVERHGHWVERTYGDVEETYTDYKGIERTVTTRECVKVTKRRKSPLPKALQNPAGERIVRAFLAADSDKWGPAAGVELNARETKTARSRSYKGKQGIHAYGFGGSCSS